jgi:hypothetical protein
VRDLVEGHGKQDRRDHQHQLLESGGEVAEHGSARLRRALLSGGLLDRGEAVPLVEPHTQVNEPAREGAEGAMMIPLPGDFAAASGTPEQRGRLKRRRRIHGISSYHAVFGRLRKVSH